MSNEYNYHYYVTYMSDKRDFGSCPVHTNYKIKSYKDISAIADYISKTFADGGIVIILNYIQLKED